MNSLNFEEIKLGIIGLGYVGLPLAVEFGMNREVIAFDINQKRISDLKNGIDSTLEVDESKLKSSSGLFLSNNENDLALCNILIVTVPTPIDENNNPNLDPLKKASKLIGGLMKKGTTVVYESTVYPGATEEVCVPILQKESGYIFNKDFFVAYSPERINPGDKKNSLINIIKIISGSTDETCNLVNQLYLSIIKAGTYVAPSIKIAEAAKVIENTQRDLNIAIINEFAKIFNILDIDTEEILKAAQTKWNFLPFKPGLVGGHCISVDPYYLTYKANEVGYQPEVILAGRRINDGMAKYVATQLVKRLSQEEIHINESRILIMGFTFKGDCPDVRNTKIFDIISELKLYNAKVDVFDKWADRSIVSNTYNIELLENIPLKSYDAIVLAVDHSDFKKCGEEVIRKYGKDKHILYDLKHILPISSSDMRL